MTTRSKLLFTEVWSTTFVFQDIYNESSVEFKKHVDSLTDTQFAEFIEENLHPWHSGFESGMMSNWESVARTAASDTKLPDNN